MYIKIGFAFLMLTKNVSKTFITRMLNVLILDMQIYQKSVLYKSPLLLKRKKNVKVFKINELSTIWLTLTVAWHARGQLTHCLSHLNFKCKRRGTICMTLNAQDPHAYSCIPIYKHIKHIVYMIRNQNTFEAMHLKAESYIWLV